MRVWPQPHKLLMSQTILRVVITGAAGRIAYSLLPMIGNGLAFGPNQVTDVVLFDIPEKDKMMHGIKLEMIDCAFNCIRDIIICTDEEKAFLDADVVIFLGAAPRKDGMQRVDLLAQNKCIFEKQGKLMDKYSKKTVRAVVIGNPANTNALILAESAPSVPKENITCMMRLDHNRALAMISNELLVPAESVTDVVVWGNHSNTQYPSVEHLKVNGKAYSHTASFLKWAENEMLSTVRKRGFEVISYLGSSSALSAAKATCDHIRDWFVGNDKTDFVTMGVYSNGSYEIQTGLYFGMPVKCLGNFQYEIVKGLQISPEGAANIAATADELVKEKNLAFSQ